MTSTFFCSCLLVWSSIYNHIQELLLQLPHVARSSGSQHGLRRQRDKNPVSYSRFFSCGRYGQFNCFAKYSKQKSLGSTLSIITYFLFFLKYSYISDHFFSHYSQLSLLCVHWSRMWLPITYLTSFLLLDNLPSLGGYVRFIFRAKLWILVENPNSHAKLQNWFRLQPLLWVGIGSSSSNSKFPSLFQHNCKLQVHLHWNKQACQDFIRYLYFSLFPIHILIASISCLPQVKLQITCAFHFEVKNSSKTKSNFLLAWA